MEKEEAMRIVAAEVVRIYGFDIARRIFESDRYNVRIDMGSCAHIRVDTDGCVRLGVTLVAKPKKK